MESRQSEFEGDQGQATNPTTTSMSTAADISKETRRSPADIRDNPEANGLRISDVVCNSEDDAIADRNRSPSPLTTEFDPTEAPDPEEGLACSDRNRFASVEHLPLYHDLEPISSLGDEYDETSEYKAKAAILCHRYTSIRRVRKDGNCFYRAFGLRLMELLNDEDDDGGKLVDSMKAKTSQCAKALEKLGYPSVAVSDFCETFSDLLDRARAGQDIDMILSDLVTNTNNYMVVMLRLFVSVHLQENSDFFGAFIEGERSMKEFCSAEVEPMGVDADHMHISALIAMLEIPVKVVYMDRLSAGVSEHTTPDGANAKIILLYRPSHYDILY